ncbi:hypothetical protein OGAPHI_004190 [Ogataea philodendri]|uniref:Uncharacterized protein n=1 Tax=Ogataea philodendri TaxID=1378263 RepID=A0A9P8T4R5_9ASCO|nr:uncharacterized protein OGAPHI_004190 [Ogataea philodendri]KAH3666001.1 hypothetical protein OGAPHI_004190 [Ogataea philodendri]
MPEWLSNSADPLKVTCGMMITSSIWVGPTDMLTSLYEIGSVVSGPTISSGSRSLSVLATRYTNGDLSSFRYSNSVSVKIDSPVHWINGSPLLSRFSKAAFQSTSLRSRSSLNTMNVMRAISLAKNGWCDLARNSLFDSVSRLLYSSFQFSSL